jgi:hypothetical protein
LQLKTRFQAQSRHDNPITDPNSDDRPNQKKASRKPARGTGSTTHTERKNTFLSATNPTTYTCLNKQKLRGLHLAPDGKAKLRS